MVCSNRLSFRVCHPSPFKTFLDHLEYRSPVMIRAALFCSGWMDGWVGGWMDGWNGQTDEQTDRWMEGMIDK